MNTLMFSVTSIERNFSIPPSGMANRAMICSAKMKLSALVTTIAARP
jgi:hypothetical protein